MKELISSQNKGTCTWSKYTTGKFKIYSLIDFVRAQLRLTTGKEMLSRHILSILPNSSILIRYNC